MFRLLASRLVWLWNNVARVRKCSAVVREKASLQKTTTTNNWPPS